MAKDWIYGEKNNIELTNKPTQLLRITGHRIASILGLNQYQTPFGAWCEITKLVKLPFEDNKYTLAGKAIEPKLINIIRNEFPNVFSIEEYYGNNIDKYKWNNFIDDSKIFGGIIDAVSTEDDMKTLTMIAECKTSSKPQAWANNQVPVDYLLQGALYSYLKGLDRVLFVCAFLKDDDYNHPENFIPTKDNTIMVVKKLKDIIVDVNGKLITFDEAIEYCNDWWNKYIINGVSPEFDEVKDKEYLDIIRASKPINDNSLEDLCKSAEVLSDQIDSLKESIGLDEKEKELNKLEENIKSSLISALDDGETKTSFMRYKLSGTLSKKFNAKAFQEKYNDLYDDYCEDTITYKLTKIKKEGKNDEN